MKIKKGILSNKKLLFFLSAGSIFLWLFLILPNQETANYYQDRINELKQAAYNQENSEQIISRYQNFLNVSLQSDSNYFISPLNQQKLDNNFINRIKKAKLTILTTKDNIIRYQNFDLWQKELKLQGYYKNINSFLAKTEKERNQVVYIKIDNNQKYTKNPDLIINLILYTAFSKL